MTIAENHFFMLFRTNLISRMLGSVSTSLYQRSFTFPRSRTLPLMGNPKAIGRIYLLQSGTLPGQVEFEIRTTLMRPIKAP